VKPISNVFYLVAPALIERVRQEMIEAGAHPPRGPRSKDWLVLSGPNRTCRFHLQAVRDDTAARLREHYFSFVVVDARCAPGEQAEQQVSLALRFVEQIHYTADPDLRYPLSRIIVVLDADHRLADQAFALGRQRIGGFVTDPLSGSLFAKMDALRDANPGKTAICLAGGGVEGFLFEVGVMKALNAHLQTRSVTEMDIYCGISAGAILASFLANGTEPEEIDEAIAAQKGREIDPVTPSVVYDPHFREYAARVVNLARSLPTGGWGQVVSNLLKTVPAGFFRGDALLDFVERQLTKGGRTNDFRELEKELYIGATDQDTSSHVIFGDGQWRDIPISLAVRASSSLSPFFDPTKIRGRYYVDGQYTRTSNFHLAIERGAKLVIIVDPLVPIRVDLPGYVRKKGGVFAALQGLKAVIHTRFLHAFQAATDAHPNVDFVLFTPEGNDMRLMSGSPMKYNIRTEILNMSYRYAVRRIQRDFEILSGTFAKHGFPLQRHPRLRTGYRQVF
jgi:predicted acylesterase/phospholipase RssA